MSRNKPHPALLSVYRLPSGRTVQVRRIEGEQYPDAIVRYMSEDGELATSEFHLSLQFLMLRAVRLVWLA